MREGLHVYIGTTGTGKTHKAIRDALALSQELKRGLLVIDSRGAENLKEIPSFGVFPGSLQKNLPLFDHVYSQGKVARVVPNNQEEFDLLMKAADRIGNFVIMIDEISSWAANTTFQDLCRVWRHRKISFFLTTQKVGRDVQQTVLACDPTIWAFRVTNPTSLEWFEKYAHVAPETLKGLQVGQFLEIQL